MALMTREEYCRFRDQHALDGYHQRWPVLNEKKAEIIKERAYAVLMVKSCYVITNGVRNEYESRVKELNWEYQNVVGEMALIETDAPIRKERLGIQ